MWGDLAEERVISGTVALPQGTRVVRIRGGVCELDVSTAATGELSFAGKTLRVARTRERLDAAMAVDYTFHAGPGEAPDELLLAVPDFPPATVATGAPETAPEAEAAADRGPTLIHQVKAVIRVPPGLAIIVEADKGHIKVAGRQAPVTISTHGTVVVTNHSDVLRIDNRGDETIVDQQGGPLHIRAGGRTQVRCVRVVGTVDVENQKSELDVTLPATVSMRLEARSLRGRVVDQFALPAEKTDAGGMVVRGAVGGGEHRVHLTAVQGTLTLRSADLPR
jgi:hypothetical protein